MKNFRRVFLSLLILSLSVNFPVMAASEQWIDATHSFEKEVQALSKTVKLETKVDNAKRYKAPAPVKKVYKVGDVETFWTKNIAENKFEKTEAVLKALGKNCYVFVERGKNVADSAVQKIQKSFDEKIYPVDTKVFGSEWKPGIDGDERITLLMFDIKDGFTGKGGYVGGYFFAGDEFLQSQIPAEIPVKSNEREMFYLDIYPSDPTSDHYMAVVAHEFQHMIHFVHDPKETTWVNESCSQIAPFLCGFGHAGQILSYMKAADNSMTAWSEEQMIANYGQVYLWNYYLVNRYLKSASSLVSFFRELVDDKVQGKEGFEKALKKFNTSFHKEFVNFSVTNFVNDPNLGKGEYAYDDSLKRFKLPPVATLKAFPANVKEKVFLNSADGIKVDLSSAKKNLEVKFSGKAVSLDGKRSSFSVAVVLSDSRNQEKPMISFMSLDSNSTGKLPIVNGKLDTMIVVITALAPMGVDDRSYAKSAPVAYSVDVTDSGETPRIARSVAVDSNELVRNYLTFAGSLDDSDPKAYENSVSVLDNLTSEVGRTVSSQLEEGSFELIDSLIVAGENDLQKESLRPLANKVARQVQAWKLQNPNSGSELQTRIESLKLL